MSQGPLMSYTISYGLASQHESNLPDPNLHINGPLPRHVNWAKICDNERAYHALHWLAVDWHWLNLVQVTLLQLQIPLKGTSSLSETRATIFVCSARAATRSHISSSQTPQATTTPIGYDCRGYRPTLSLQCVEASAT